MKISIGKRDFNVTWGNREEYIQLYPQHTRGTGKTIHQRQSFKTKVITCVITEQFDTPKISVHYNKGVATCSPREPFNDTKGRRIAFVRSVDQLLLREVPGKEKVDGLVRRGIKQDIFDKIYAEKYNTEIGI